MLKVEVIAEVVDPGTEAGVEEEPAIEEDMAADEQ